MLNIFQGCSSLTSVTIPSNITSIGDYAFLSCRGLTSVTIGNSVTRIGRYAFTLCNIAIVKSLIVEPKEIGSDIFDQNTLDNAKLIVPYGTIEKYKKTKGWNEFIWVEEGNGLSEGVALVPAKAVLIQTNGGSINVQGCNDGEKVGVYRIDGSQVGSAVSQNGAAAVNTSLQPGRVAIIKVGEKSVKVILK